MKQLIALSLFALAACDSGPAMVAAIPQATPDVAPTQTQNPAPIASPCPSDMVALDTSGGCIDKATNGRASTSHVNNTQFNYQGAMGACFTLGRKLCSESDMATACAKGLLNTGAGSYWTRESWLSDSATTGIDDVMYPQNCSTIHIDIASNGAYFPAISHYCCNR